MKPFRGIALGLTLAVAAASLSPAQANPFGALNALTQVGAPQLQDVRYQPRRSQRRGNAVAGALIGAALIGGIAAAAANSGPRNYYYEESYAPGYYQEPSYYHQPQSYYQSQSYYQPRPQVYHHPQTYGNPHARRGYWENGVYYSSPPPGYREGRSNRSQPESPK